MSVLLTVILVSGLCAILCAYLGNRVAFIRALKQNEVLFLEEVNDRHDCECNCECGECHWQGTECQSKFVYSVSEEEKKLAIPHSDLTDMINGAVKEYNLEHGTNVTELDS